MNEKWVKIKNSCTRKNTKSRVLLMRVISELVMDVYYVIGMCKYLVDASYRHPSIETMRERRALIIKLTE